MSLTNSELIDIVIELAETTVKSFEEARDDMYYLSNDDYMSLSTVDSYSNIYKLIKRLKDLRYEENE